MIDNMTCPKCGRTYWTIGGEPFESHGTLLILTAECTNEECQLELALGIVNGAEIKEILDG